MGTSRKQGASTAHARAGRLQQGQTQQGILSTGASAGGAVGGLGQEALSSLALLLVQEQGQPGALWAVSAPHLQTRGQGKKAGS